MTPTGARVAAGLVHAYTATGAVLALLMVHFAYEGEVQAVLWLFLAAMVVDGSDGLMARYFQVCMPLYNRRARPDADDAMARSLEHATFDVFTHWAFGEQRTFDLRPELHAITSPTLVLAGTDDPITPASGARAFVEALGPDVGSIEVFDNCGHGAWRDQPDAAFGAIRRFLTR